MERYIRVFLFGILVMFGLINTASAESVQYPLSSYVITSATCDFMGECDMTGLHMAEDVRGSAGTAVYAPTSGTVKDNSVHTRYGTVVLLEANVNGETVVFLMGHMRQADLQVSIGDSVSKGQLLGYLGTNMGDRLSPYDNGGWSDHLHFGVHKGSYYNGTSCTGAWTYAGYETAACGYDDWYDPTDFISSHQNADGIPSDASSAIDTKADELWAIKPYGGSDCADRLICEEPPGGNIHWYVNAADPFLIEDWEGGTWGGIAITYDPDTNQTDKAFVLRHGFLEYYLNSGGPDLFGPPLGDELDQTQENVYEAYDLYCTGELDYTDPEACIELFCGSSRQYSSVQRFEHTTLCWDPDEGVVCDPKNQDRSVCEQAGSDWTAFATGADVSSTDGNLWVYNSTIYWIHNGYTRGVVSEDVFEACSFDWNDPYPVGAETFSLMPQGSVVDDPVDCGVLKHGDVFTTDQTTTVYQYASGLKRGITSGDVFTACGFDWSEIQTFPASTVISIPDGSVINSFSTCYLTPDLVWRELSTGNMATWFMDGTSVSSGASLSSSDLNWSVVGSGDFNRDGSIDLLWRHLSSPYEVYLWEMDGSTVVTSILIASSSDSNWVIRGVSDFTSDGEPDILWKEQYTGELGIWIMEGTTVSSSETVATSTDTTWDIRATGDLTGDQQTDLLWRNPTNGALSLWQMDGTSYVSSITLATSSLTNWDVEAIGDFTSDGQNDLVWRNPTNGEMSIWEMDGTSYVSSLTMTSSDTGWDLVTVGEVDGN